MFHCPSFRIEAAIVAVIATRTSRSVAVLAVQGPVTGQRTASSSELVFDLA